jgi:hypothetical protein
VTHVCATSHLRDPQTHLQKARREIASRSVCGWAATYDIHNDMRRRSRHCEKLPPARRLVTFHYCCFMQIAASDISAAFSSPRTHFIVSEIIKPQVLQSGDLMRSRGPEERQRALAVLYNFFFNQFYGSLIT